MKRYCWILFVSWAAFPLVAQQQNWDLFPLGQKTWWQADDTLQVWYNDSTETSADGGRLHHFGYRYLAAPFGEDCFFNLFVVDPQPAFLPLPAIYWQDLYSKPDGSWYAGFQEPIFFSQAKPGEQWTFRVEPAANVNKIRITCTALDTLLLWGNASAVKHFRVEPLDVGGVVLLGHPLYGFEYLLSERFGLLHFIPLHLLAQGLSAPVYDMVGLEKKGMHLGQAFTFDAFMDQYRIGDLYKWHYMGVNYVEGVEIQEWWRDSVFAVQISADTGAYLAKRQVLRVKMAKANGQPSIDSTTYTIESFRKTFARDLYEPVWKAVPQWYARHENNSLLLTDGYFEQDTTLTLSADLGSWVFNQNTCALVAVADGDYKLKVNTGCGLSYRDRWSQGGYYKEQLLGCRRAVKVQGNVDPLPTVSINKVRAIRSLSAWPNPVQEVLHIGLPEPFNEESHLLLTILNASGHLLRSDWAYQPGKPIDLTGLPGGIYLVRLQGKSFVAQGRVFKIDL